MLPALIASASLVSASFNNAPEPDKRLCCSFSAAVIIFTFFFSQLVGFLPLHFFLSFLLSFLLLLCFQLLLMYQPFFLSFFFLLSFSPPPEILCICYMQTLHCEAMLE